MAENYQKKELLTLMGTGANKLCVDCGSPSPQWASVSYGTFICLECSGIHRGFGVHISFVRSITMDKWSEDQVKKMKLGGNEAFKQFLDSYGPDGGYTKGMGMSEKYNSWAASQYREKLTAECAGESWSPSAAPPPTSRPESAAATRKSRATGGAGSGIPSRTNSPYQDSPPSRGSGNEAFFERLGNANASRPDNLPPSQGGKYAGFGSAPLDDEPSHPSYHLSSHAAPTLNDFQTNPLGALSKGWGLFSSAVSSASREINESVVKPGMSRAQDMYQQGASDDWKRYVDSATTQAKGAAAWTAKRAGEGWQNVNDLSRQHAGVDFNEQFDKLGLGGRRAQDQGYGQLSQHADAREYHDGHDDDFFESWDSQPQSSNGAAASKPAAKPAAATKAAPAKEQPKKKDNWDDDEWADF
ncbi:hypothetical protein VHUM_01385 [Vanrija humicola]|uniref:Arf-GAP domain-containing protein n=1 Tax=Vanrija humicola TaxID=5417 RepID=A0A7D8V0M9_VANHU|nr:hypothetical protein VHUM_01385 [Vanrija humicola]